ncbi:MAG: DUF47 domain-containing protein [Verrucomicrobia bacterium]|jgi:uncharacterized protein|nr:DUF47 domain-containing protein [Verrucomicrobiota bacterium]
MAMLLNLVGESPFRGLEAHSASVHSAVQQLRPLFQHAIGGAQSLLKDSADRIFALETEADRIQTSLHELLASKMLIPIRKEDFLAILEHQDAMADQAESIAAALTVRDLGVPPSMEGALTAYLEIVLKNCDLAAGVISKVDLLIEASFCGRDAQSVSRLITELTERDDHSKNARMNLTRQTLGAQGVTSPLDAILWHQIISGLTEMSRSAVRTGQALRRTLKIDSIS